MKKSKFALITIVSLVCFILAGLVYFQKTQAQTAVTTISGKFYKLDVLATNTSLGIANIFPGASINDNGLVAFSAFEGVWIANGIVPVRNVTEFTGMFESTVQINNSGFLALRILPEEDIPFQSLLRLDTTTSSTINNRRGWY